MTGKRRDSLYIESINTLLVDFSPKIDRYTDNIIQDRSDHVERWWDSKGRTKWIGFFLEKRSVTRVVWHSEASSFLSSNLKVSVTNQ